MNPINVTVVSAGPSRVLSLRWKDPKTGRLKHQSSKTRDPAQASIAAAKLSADLERQYGLRRNGKWSEFRREYEKEIDAGLSRKTLEAWNSTAASIEKYIKIDSMSDIDAERIGAWQQAMRDNGLAEATVNGYSGNLKAALSWAVSREWLDSVPRILRGRLVTGRSIPARFTALEKRMTAIESSLTQIIDLLTVPK